MPYMTANVHFPIEIRNVLRAPNAALRWRPNGKQLRTPLGSGFPEPSRLWVKTADEQHVRPIEVETGQTDGTMTEVSGKDVKEGMEVVVGEEDAKQASAKPASLQTMKVTRGDLLFCCTSLARPCGGSPARSSRWTPANRSE